MRNNAALILFWTILIFLVNPFGNFPLNDDWRYAYPVKSLLENGNFQILDDFAPTIILQVVWAYIFSLPIGEFSFTILRFSTLFLAGIGILAFYKLGRLLSIPSNLALLASLVLMLNPLYFNLSFSFMTDVPFLVGFLLTTLGVLGYIKKRNSKNLGLIVIGSILCFLIRQPGILILPALALLFLIEKKFNRHSVFTFIIAVSICFIAWSGFEKLLKPALNMDEAYVPVSKLFFDSLIESPLNFGLEIFKKIIKSVIYLGFFSIPVIPFLINRIKQSGGFKMKVFLAVIIPNIALLVFLHFIGKIFPFGGNIMFNAGLGPKLLTDTYSVGLPVIPQAPFWVMYFLNFVSQLIGCWIIWLIVKFSNTLNSTQKSLFLFLILFNALYLPLMSITSFYDRYLLIPIASLLLFLLCIVDPAQLKVKLSFKWLPFVLMALFSIAATKDYLSWNRAKLKAFNYLQDQHISMTQIDAGFELNGWYNYQKNYKPKEDQSFWWVNDDKYMISFNEMKNFEVVEIFQYPSLLSLSIENILILQKKE